MAYSSTEKILRDQGIRCTRPRIAIYECLASIEGHPTAEDLHSIVCDRYEHVSLATIYNTLTVFEETGLCRKISSSAGSRFCSADSQGIHVQLRIAGQDELVDLPLEYSKLFEGLLDEGLLEQLGRSLGMDINGLQVELLAHQHDDQA